MDWLILLSNLTGCSLFVQAFDVNAEQMKHLSQQLGYYPKTGLQNKSKSRGVLNNNYLLCL